jgi:N-acyl-D-aspartate/D-glutamate deacylase
VVRAQVRQASERGVDGGFSWIGSVGYGNIRIVSAPSAPELVDQNIELLARATGVEPFDLVAELVLTRDGVRVTLGSIDENDIRELIVEPWVMVASDGAYLDEQAIASGAAHPRSAGSFTRVLGYYSRDLGLFSLEEAIRKMTSMPAEFLGLSDRGRIAPGMAADIVVFDPDTIAAMATYDDPAALSTGVEYVLVNGELAFDAGVATLVTAGRFVRH